MFNAGIFPTDTYPLFVSVTAPQNFPVHLVGRFIPLNVPEESFQLLSKTVFPEISSKSQYQESPPHPSQDFSVAPVPAKLHVELNFQT